MSGVFSMPRIYRRQPGRVLLLSRLSHRGFHTPVIFGVQQILVLARRDRIARLAIDWETPRSI
jgi:hypothetical protein